jgi:hypothetical protein
MKEQSFQERWQSLRPDLRAALVMFFPVLILGFFEVLTSGFGTLCVKPLEIVFFLAQGVLVARYASTDKSYSKTDYFRLGMQSAVILQVMLVVFLGVGLIFLHALTVGLLILGLPIFLAARLGGILFNVVLASLASGFQERYGGSKLAVMLVATAVISMVIFVTLVLILVAILAAVGITLFS